MLIIEDIEVKWNKRNKEHFESFGYIFAVTGGSFFVKSNELTKGSHAIVKVLCDYCILEIVEKAYKTYIQQNGNSVINKDCCLKCKNKKTLDSNMKTYGVSNVMHVDIHKQTLTNTNLERYGVENAGATPESRAKARATSLDKYGVEHYFQVEGYSDEVKKIFLDKYGKEWYTQTEEYQQKVYDSSMKNYGVSHFGKSDIHKQRMINGTQAKYGVDNPFQAEVVKDKIKATHLKNHGVEYYAQTQEFKDKSKETWGSKTIEEIGEITSKREATSIANYGVPHPMQDDEIKGRAMKTMSENNNAPTSKQQTLIHSLIGGEINYPVGRCFLDIAFVDSKIYFEYDGGGHDLVVKFGTMSQKQFIEKEKRRTYFLFDLGWREIRLVSSDDKLPSNEMVLKLINKAKEFLNNNPNKSIIINLDLQDVLISFKRIVSINDFLQDNYSSEWKVS